jgi:acyl-CoA thioesterase-1
MDIGVARQAQAIIARAAAIVVVGIAAALVPSAAQDAPSQAGIQPNPAPPTLSAVCEVPVGAIASPAPLPHLAAALQEHKKIIRVMAIGSSSTVGLGASSPARNYPAQFEAILERTFKGLDVVIINRGVSGELAASTAERLKLQVALERPDVVLWQVGTNDALSRVPLDDFIDTVRDTVRWLKEHGIDTVLVGLQYSPRVARDGYYASIRSALKNLATAENVLLVRRFEAMEFIEKAKEEQLLSADNLHLNDLGYQCMAEHIARSVVISAFMRRPPSP